MAVNPQIQRISAIVDNAVEEGRQLTSEELLLIARILHQELKEK